MKKVYYLALTIFFTLIIANPVNPLSDVHQDFAFNFHIDEDQLLFPHNTMSTDDIKIPVPIPKTVFLLSVSLVCLVTLRRKLRN